MSSGAFDEITFILESANWIIFQTTTSADCDSGSPSTTLMAAAHPLYQIPADTIEFKAYAI